MNLEVRRILIESAGRRRLVQRVGRDSTYLERDPAPAVQTLRCAPGGSRSTWAPCLARSDVLHASVRYFWLACKEASLGVPLRGATAVDDAWPASGRAAGEAVIGAMNWAVHRRRSYSYVVNDSLRLSWLLAGEDASIGDLSALNVSSLQELAGVSTRLDPFRLAGSKE